MAKTRSKFSPEFKREVVALLGNIGQPVTQGRSKWYLAVDISGLASGDSRLDLAIEGIGGDHLANASLAYQAAQITRLKRGLDRTRIKRDSASEGRPCSLKSC